MRAAKVPRNLSHRTWLPIGKQIEGGNLRKGEFTRRQLLRR
jgi:hypothetical protein